MVDAAQRITVITVCLNSEATIGGTVESVLSQDYPNVEYIIVDGASEDRTLECIARYGSRISRVVSGPDRGIYDAMNKGIRLATGDIVGFLNSDDIYSSGRALGTVASAFRSTGTEIVYGDLCYVRKTDTSKIVRYWKSSTFRPSSFKFGWCPPHPTFFARRSLFQELGGFDLRFKIAADFELMLRFMETHRRSTKYVPEVLVSMRLGGETNRSLRNIVRQNREIIKALRLHDMNPSWTKFLAHKIWLKGTQFAARPDA